MSIHQKEILGVRVDFGYTKSDVVNLILNKDKSSNCRQICTVNSEYIVDAFSDTVFKDAINSSYISLPDSSGIVWASEFLNFMTKYEVGYKNNPIYVFKSLLKSCQAMYTRDADEVRVSGSDIFNLLMTECEKGTISMFILGGNPGNGQSDASSSIVGNSILKKNNKALVGFTSSYTPNESDDAATLSFINSKAQELCIESFDIVVVAYGHNKQDKWINRNINKLSARYAIGVGGSVDFVSGYQHRAPSVLRRLHLEWLWRLILSPNRIKRIINALIVFPYLVINKSN